MARHLGMLESVEADGIAAIVLHGILQCAWTGTGRVGLEDPYGATGGELRGRERCMPTRSCDPWRSSSTR